MEFESRRTRYLGTCALLIALLTPVESLFAALPLGIESELAAPMQASTVDRPSSIIWADIDGDGDVDPVGTEGTDIDGSLYWFAYDSVGGTFGFKDTISAFVGAQAVTAADLDNDGDLDLVATSFFDAKVSWFENTAGDASAWTEHAIDTGVLSADDVATADLDQDGDQDVLVAERGSGGIIHIYINDGTPAVGAWPTETIDGPTGSGSVSVGDIDRDGDPDIAASARAGDTVVWYQNNAPTLDAWTERTIETSIDNPIHTRLADMDGDGDLDVVVTARIDDVVNWYENDGDPTDDVGDWTLHSIDPSIDGPYLAHPGDFDLDGDIDVLVAAEVGDVMRSYENLDGTGTSWQQQTLTSSFDGIRWAVTGDPDHDGDLDVVAVANGATDDKVIYWPNESLFQVGIIDSQEVVWTSPVQLVDAVGAGDIDGDGDLDLVGGGRLNWFENTDGLGTAWTDREIDSGFNARQLAVTDLDRDGDLDLVVGNGLGGEIHWYESDGSPTDGVGGGLGTSWTSHSVETGVLQRVENLVIGDFNGDGHTDIAATANSDDLILWWENDGSPADDVGGDGNSWTERTVATSPDSENATGLQAGDIDGDGDLDLVTVSQDGPDKVSWWANNGSGTAWTATSPSGGLPFGVAVFDFDRDGDLDIANSEGIADILQVSRNSSGDGTTWAGPDTLYSYGVLDPLGDPLVVSDFDLDGDFDMAFVIGSEDRVIWLENPGATPWIDHTIDTVSDQPMDLLAADVDGDGDDDLVAAIRSDLEVVWYRNESGQFALATTDQAPSPGDGEEDDLLKIDLAHGGRSGDGDVELATLELLLEETAGDPLDGAEAANLFDAINVYADTNDDGMWDGGDTLLAQETVFTPVDGVITIDLPDDNADLQAAFGVSKTLFVTALLTATASQSPPQSFRVTHLTSSSSRGEDADFDTGLRLAWAEDVSSTLVVLISCYKLTLSHTGFGADPVPSIAQSNGCPNGTYVEGEFVKLTAAPDPDYVVDSWTGTDDDASTSTQNGVTMPAMPHAAAVNYVFPDHIEISNEVLVGPDTREACLTVSAGPAVDVDSGIVVFRASEQVALKAGFTVSTGAVFWVDMELPDRCSP